MKDLNFKKAYFLWTDERATHIYKRFGFDISRTFAILEKHILKTSVNDNASSN